MVYGRTALSSLTFFLIRTSIDWSDSRPHELCHSGIWKATLNRDIDALKEFLSRCPRTAVNPPVDFDAWPHVGSLTVAAVHGDVEAAKLLLEKGARTDSRSFNGTTSLIGASKFGNEAVASLLLEFGADPETADEEGGTPLMWAAESGQTGMLSLLLSSGASTQTRDHSGLTALHRACLAGQLQAAHVLSQYEGTDTTFGGYLSVGGSMEGCFKGGRPKQRCHSVLSCLAKVGADVDARVGGDGRWGMAHEAALRGDNDGIGLMVRLGADLSAPDEDGHTPVMYAVRARHLDTARLLVDNGGKVAKGDEAARMLRESIEQSQANIADTEIPSLVILHAYSVLVRAGADLSAPLGGEGGAQHTALTLAASMCHVETVRRLLEDGADIDREAEGLGTALWVAVDRGHLPVVLELLARHANLGSPEGRGGDLVQLALSRNRPDIAEALVTAGARVYEGPGGWEWDLLVQAVTQNSPEVVRVLLRAGVALGQRVTGPGVEGHTLLTLAAKKGHAKVVEVLLSAGASVDEAGRNGRLAMHEAAGEGHGHMVELLLAHGADPAAADERGMTPLAVASAMGRDDVVDVMLRRGAAKAGSGVDGRDYSGMTALQHACSRGHAKVAEQLVGAGASPTAWAPAPEDATSAPSSASCTNYSGPAMMSAFGLATVRGHVSVVKTLLESGVDVDAAVGRSKDTALDQALRARSSGNGVLELLLDSGARVCCGGEPLVVGAVRSGIEPPLLRSILDRRGGIVDDVDREGLTALHVACLLGACESVGMLLDAGADSGRLVGETGGRLSGYTALAIAAGGGHAACARELLNRGADVNQLTGRNDTALQVACFMGQGHVVDLLLARGAVVRGDEMSRAAYHGHFRVVEALYSGSALAHDGEALVRAMGTAWRNSRYATSAWLAVLYTCSKSGHVCSFETGWQVVWVLLAWVMLAQLLRRFNGSSVTPPPSRPRGRRRTGLPLRSGLAAAADAEDDDDARLQSDDSNGSEDDGLSPQAAGSEGDVYGAGEEVKQPLPSPGPLSGVNVPPAGQAAASTPTPAGERG